MLTNLEEAVADAHGLAIAAVAAAVEPRVPDPALVRELQTMARDADEFRARCLDLTRELGDGRADELSAHANSVAERSADLVAAWFGAGTGPVAAWTFLALSEAAELAAWNALAALAKRADASGDATRTLVAWALPTQQRHLRAALDGAATLAASLDPEAPRWG